MITYSDDDTVHDFSSTVTGKRPSQADLRDYFKSLGYSDAGAAGIAKRSVIESGLNPGAKGDGGSSYGLFQHHNERWDALQKYADENGLDSTDWHTQASFADREMQRDLPGLRKLLTTTEDENLAYNQFTDVFERPAKGSGSGYGLGRGGVRFSDFSLNEPDADPNTDLVSMSPQAYLDMSPPLQDPWTDKSGKSLLSSLKNGDAVEQVPSLKVNKDGEVEDQDGRHRALAAQDAGMDSIPVAIQKPAGITLPAQIKGMQGAVMPTPQVAPQTSWRDWLIPRAEAAERSPQPVSANPASALPQSTISTEHIQGRKAQINFGEDDKPVEFGANDQATPNMSRAEQFGSGLLDMPLRGAQLAADAASYIPGPQQGLVTQGANAMDQFMANRQAEIAARGGDTFMRTLGNVPGSIALGATMGPVAAGAAAGALTPTDSNSLGSLAMNAGLGAAGGKVAGMVGNALRGKIGPLLQGARNLLAREGVNMTPGQLAGGVMQRAENALASMPVLGSMIRNAEVRSIEDFNKAAINRALSPIGQRLPPNVPAGQPAIEFARRALQDAYNSVLPRMVGQLDQGLQADIQHVVTLGQNLPQLQRGELNRLVQDVLSRFSPGGGISGPTVQSIGERLGNLAASQARSENNDYRIMSGAVRELDAALDRMMDRTNPTLAPAKQAIDLGYANFKIVQRAATYQNAKDGVFTPSQLSGAVRARDRTKDKRAFSEGAALMQDLSDAAKEVLPSKVPDSGTPERAMWAAGLGGMAHFQPHTAAVMGLGSIPYTRPAVAGMNWLARNPQIPTGNALTQLGTGIRQYGAAPAGVAAAQAGEDLRR